MDEGRWRYERDASYPYEVDLDEVPEEDQTWQDDLEDAFLTRHAWFR